MATIEVNLDDYTSFVITGVDVYGKRFKRTYNADVPGFRTATMINVFNGTLWGVRSDTGKRQRLISYSN
jgi:hypothetical protein